MVDSNEVNPVTMPPGRARLDTKPLATGSPTSVNTMGLALCAQGRERLRRLHHDHLGSSSKEHRSSGLQRFGLISPARQQLEIPALEPAGASEPLANGRKARLRLRMVLAASHQHANSPHALLLRHDVERPRGSGARENCDDLPPPHSITSSARARSVAGIVRLSALAVFRFITSSCLVGACTGKSAGYSPLRIRSM